MRVVSWNINCFNPRRTGEKAALLGALDWDVALLQEVGRDPFERLAGIDGVEAAEALALTGGEHHRRQHGAAILSRVGPLDDLEVLPGLPTTERFLAASIDVDGRRLRVASWHAPNGPVAERMDRIFVSGAVQVDGVEHHLDDVVAVGSDHADEAAAIVATRAEARCGSLVPRARRRCVRRAAGHPGPHRSRSG